MHPSIAFGVVALTALTVYFGRRSAKAPTESYQPILRIHIILASTTIALASVLVVIGPLVVSEFEPPLKSAHAYVGLTVVSLYIAQALMGWNLWNDREAFRKYHRYTGFTILGLAFVQVAFGVSKVMEFLSYGL